MFLSRFRADNAAERDAERSADPTPAEAQHLGVSVSGLPSQANSTNTVGVAAPEPEPGVGVVRVLYLFRVLYSVMSPHFIPSPCFIPSPQSVVRSPQSVFYTDRF